MIAALLLFLSIVSTNGSLACAQSGDGSASDVTIAPSDQQNSDDPSDTAQPAEPEPNQQTSDAASSAQASVDAAVQQLQQLKNDGASQDEINAAYKAVAEARAAKQAANQGVQNPNDAPSQ